MLSVPAPPGEALLFPVLLPCSVCSQVACRAHPEAPRSTAVPGCPAGSSPAAGRELSGSRNVPGQKAGETVRARWRLESRPELHGAALVLPGTKRLCCCDSGSECLWATA